MAYRAIGNWAGISLPLMSPDVGPKFAGTRIRPRFRLPEKWLPFKMSVSTELGFNKHQFDPEHDHAGSASHPGEGSSLAVLAQNDAPKFLLTALNRHAYLCAIVHIYPRGRMALMGNELQVAVIGPAGNAGQELTRMLFQHPRLRPPLLLAPANDGAGSMSELKLDSGTVHPFSWSIIHRQGVDLLFVAASQTAARMLIPEAAAHGLRVIDLSTAARGRSKDLQGALGKAVQEMNSIYGWSQTEGLA